MGPTQFKQALASFTPLFLTVCFDQIYATYMYNPSVVNMRAGKTLCFPYVDSLFSILAVRLYTEANI